MAPPRMTPSEKLVGWKIPKEPSYLDQILAGYVNDDGTFRGGFKPSDSYLGPAHLKARRSGFIRASTGISFFANGNYLWYLTPKGEEAATAAKARVKFIRDERKRWANELMAIHRAAAAKRKEAETADMAQ